MTQTLFRLFPISRITLTCRMPFWAQALAICALFATVGVGVLDDYGVTWDDVTQRRIANANAEYISTGDTNVLHYRDYRYFGVAFEMPLLLAERALGLRDSRHIYLTRHLLTHLFFIAGGFACAMLTYRMLGSRWIALFAMLMFLLHPRLYAHSFFNTKDIPFAATLLITLYLAHRAFRKDTLGAFLLCGIGVGLAINQRPFGLMLLPMILAMRALDLWQAGRVERKRIPLTSAALLAAALAVVYITHPYYWENPLRFIESMGVMSQHPIMLRVLNLFMGETYMSDAVPWNYIPVWFAITALPVALPLGALGFAAVCWQAITRPLAALRDRELRFRVLLLGCFVLPVIVVIALQSNIYNGWRHMYFLWAPFCLLAAVGLHRIANIRMEGGIWKVMARLPGWVRRGGCRFHMAQRALAYGVVGVGLITTLTAMAALHPHQQVYFNALADTKTPGERYDMDYYLLADRQLLEYLLARHPDGIVRVLPTRKSVKLLPRNDRDRILMPVSDREANYRIPGPFARRNAPDEPAIHSIRAYGSVLAYINAPDMDARRDAHRAEYGDVEANGALLTRADFDIYIHNGSLYYLKENCGTLQANAEFRVFLRIIPIDPADLPAHSRERGFESNHFPLAKYATFFDNQCIVKHPFPDYPIARIRTGQDAAAGGIGEWLADIDMVAHVAAQALYDGIAAGDYGRPVAESRFDVYLRGNVLAYLRESCGEGAAAAKFFLHIFPVDPADLPADARERGFANLDFEFADYGARAGDKCVAERELPEYPIDRIRTGQFVSGEGRLWGAEFPAARQLSE